MHDSKSKLSYLLGILLIVWSFAYADNITENQNTMREKINILIKNGKPSSAINFIDSTIKKKKKDAIKIKQTDAMQFAILYDDVAELMILKNNLLSDMEKIEDINTDLLCDFVLEYEETEFIKTNYYQTPFHDDVAKTLTYIVNLYEFCHPPFAQKYLKSIIQIKEKLYGSHSEELAQSIDNLAYYLQFHVFRLGDAIKYYKQAKIIRESLYKKDDARVTKNYARLGITIFYHTSDKIEAEQLILESLKIRKADNNVNRMLIYEALMDAANFYDLIEAHKISKEYALEAEKIFSQYITD